MGFALSDMQIKSSAFTDGGAIPARHTGESDEDVSPELSWSKAPEGTRSFAVFCHDPDAPLVSESGSYGFVHWLLYNIPPSVNSVEEGTREYAHGKNNMGANGYNGPMPPNGHGLHRYYFWIVALDIEPSLPDGLRLDEFLEKVEPHVLGMNRVVGTYQRD